MTFNRTSSFLKGTTIAAASALLLASGASAATLDITSVSGLWTSVNPESGISGVNSSTISWGTSTGYGQSSYTFVGVAPPPVIGLAADTAFNLGTFTHKNYPITGTTLGTAELTVNIGIKIDGSAQSVSSVFDFKHIETTNSGTCLPNSTSVCDDLVTATTNAASSQTFNIAGTDYIFNVSGFLVGGAIFDSFLTAENADNVATLQASYSVAEQNIPPVPLPAAGWMLLAGLGGLGVARRARKR